MVGRESVGYWSKDGTLCTFFLTLLCEHKFINQKNPPQNKKTNKKRTELIFFEEGVVSKGY